MKQHSLLALLAAGLIFGGCTTPGQSNSGWQPQTQREWEILIGNTVMRAMDQYEAHLRTSTRPLFPGDAT